MDAKTLGASTAFPLNDAQAIHAYASARLPATVADPNERDLIYIAARAEAVGGLTKRELFAAMAMQGVLSGPGEDWGDEELGPEGTANWAVRYADALLAELAKDQP